MGVSGDADLKTHLPQWLGVPGMHPMGPRGKIKDGLGGLTRGLHRIYKPIVAAVNGWALAGGFETALACDIRIASERAQFGSFEIRRGFHHADGGDVRLVNTCGVGFALEMLLTGEAGSAQRALATNLVSKVVAHDELDAAEDTASRILRNDQTALESAKETVFEVIGRPGSGYGQTRATDVGAPVHILGYRGHHDAVECVHVGAAGCSTRWPP